MSPDLLRLQQQAEQALADGFVEKAFRLYERIKIALPDDEELSGLVNQLRDRALRARSVTTSSDGEEETSAALLRDLGFGEGSRETRLDLRDEIGAFLSVPADRFAGLGLVAAVVTGLSGDWELSDRLVQRADRETPSPQTKLWRLRVLVELERYTEALAAVNAIRWTADQMLHVNYLAGLALEALGLADQARRRFDAVRKIDPKYRGVSEKLGSS